MDGATTAVVGTLTGCMSCMVVVESLANRQPSAMNLMTFANFLFIAIEGLVFTSKFFTVRNKIPIRAYVPVVLMFCFVNVVNNQALNYHVPVPLHIIFRSGSLFTSLVMSRVILGREYTRKKYWSVAAISIGIIMCTLATAQAKKESASDELTDHTTKLLNETGEEITLEEANKHFREWVIGITMLTVALVASSALALMQEKLYREHGKHPREAMFYTIFYETPPCSPKSPPLEFAGINFVVPELWAFLLLSSAFQWLCISYVYMANSEMDSLSVTLLVTLRKFFSLLISIVYFKNVFTLQHWSGAALVFIGTLVYSGYLLRDAPEPKKKQ
ncbi:UAA transporter family protein [Aphelenchoides besseyi]|nr:UAA transporter family protein [Aphelenchoides besseyi]